MDLIFYTSNIKMTYELLTELLDLEAYFESDCLHVMLAKQKIIFKAGKPISKMEFHFKMNTAELSLLKQKLDFLKYRNQTKSIFTKIKCEETYEGFCFTDQDQRKWHFTECVITTEVTESNLQILTSEKQSLII
jgi:hypothetical protein